MSVILGYPEPWSNSGSRLLFNQEIRNLELMPTGDPVRSDFAVRVLAGFS